MSIDCNTQLTDKDHQLSEGDLSSDEGEFTCSDGLVDKLAGELQLFAKAYGESRDTKKKPGRPKKSKIASGSQNDDRLVKVLEALVEKVSGLETEVKSFGTMLKSAMDRITKLEQENIGLKNKLEEKDAIVRDQEKRLEDIEGHVRADFVVISGRSVSSEKTDLHQRMSHQLSNALTISIDVTDRFIYRKLGNGTNKVLVKVANYDDRVALFTAAKKDRPKDLFVNDYLIPSRDKLLYEVRKRKQDLGFYAVFSLRGRIFIKKRKDSDKIMIGSLEDVTKLQSAK
jgi:hypothetical protein